MSGSYRKQQLKEEEGSLEKQGGVTIQRSIGRGPKENAAQTPDVGTPFTHAHTHLYKDTPMERGGCNEGRLSCAWRVLSGLVCWIGEAFVAQVNSFFGKSSPRATFFNKQAKTKKQKANPNV